MRLIIGNKVYSIDGDVHFIYAHKYNTISVEDSSNTNRISFSHNVHG